MRFGVCAGTHYLPALEQAGFDYIEMGMSSDLKPEQPESEIMPALLAAFAASSLKAEAFNVLLPGDLKVVGPTIDTARQERYLHSAFQRAAALGGRVVVFGSGGARGIPEGFSRTTARQQVEEFMALAGDVAAANNLILALEPLGSAECNHINSVAEGTEIVKAVAHPAVFILSDLHHLTSDGQSLEETRQAGSLLKHVHVAGSVNRRAPVADDIPFLIPLFRILKDINYGGSVSVEGHWDNLESQAAETYQALTDAWAAA